MQDVGCRTQIFIESDILNAEFWVLKEDSAWFIAKILQIQKCFDWKKGFEKKYSVGTNFWVKN